MCQPYAVMGVLLKKLPPLPVPLLLVLRLDNLLLGLNLGFELRVNLLHLCGVVVLHRILQLSGI